MPVNSCVALVPGSVYTESGTIGAVGHWDFFDSFGSPSAEVGAAMNYMAPYVSGPNHGVGRDWSTTFPSSNAPLLPIYLALQLWDSGTNSPSGQLPATVTITNVRLFSPYSSRGTNGNRQVLFLIRQGGTNSISGDASLGGPGFQDYATNPITGLVWTRSDIFNCFFGIYIQSSGVGTQYTVPNTATTTFYNTGSNDGLIYSDEINGLQVDVTYADSGPTEVDIVGSGGIQASGSSGTGLGMLGSGGITTGGGASILQAGAGIPPELHLNQWGLFQFVMRSRLEERL